MNRDADHHRPVPDKRSISRIKILLAFLRRRDKGLLMRRRLVTLLAGLGSIFVPANRTMAETLEIGKALPEAEARNHRGEAVKIHEVASEGWAFFFFFPKASTGG